MCDKFIPGYIAQERIGYGAFGDIWLATKQGDKTNQQYVVKAIPKERMKMAEVHAAELLDHPNIVKVYEHFENRKFFYLAMEYIEGVDLFMFLEDRDLESVPEHLTQKIFHDVASAVQYCHQHGVAHRDLKLENILINTKNQQIKLIDFGLCKIEQGDASTCSDICGSVDYISPEILEERPYDAPKSDVWSLGVILYCLLFANFPFSSEERIRALLPTFGEKQQHPPLQFPKSVIVSREARDLCRRMLTVNPSERITMDEIMEHPWLASYTKKKKFNNITNINNVNTNVNNNNNTNNNASAKSIVEDVIQTDTTVNHSNNTNNRNCSNYNCDNSISSNNNSNNKCDNQLTAQNTELSALINQVCQKLENAVTIALPTNTQWQCGRTECGRSAGCVKDECQCTAIHTAV